MKVSRIFPYIKTKGERRHEGLVKAAVNGKFNHSGSKTDKVCLL